MGSGRGEFSFLCGAPVSVAEPMWIGFAIAKKKVGGSLVLTTVDWFVFCTLGSKYSFFVKRDQHRPGRTLSLNLEGRGKIYITVVSFSCADLEPSEPQNGPGRI